MFITVRLCRLILVFLNGFTVSYSALQPQVFYENQSLCVCVSSATAVAEQNSSRLSLVRIQQNLQETAGLTVSRKGDVSRPRLKSHSHAVRVMRQTVKYSRLILTQDGSVCSTDLLVKFLNFASLDHMDSTVTQN